MNKAALLAIGCLLASVAFSASAQTYIAADCAITYRQPGNVQLSTDARVGVPPTSTSADYAWNMAFVFAVPSGPIKSARLVFPTAGTGFGIDAAATSYLTIIPGYAAAATCAGQGPGFINSAKPKKDNSITVLASTVVTPYQTGDITFPLNAKALSILRTKAGIGAVFGVSILVPRVPVYKDGEWTQGNQVGAIVNFSRGAQCSATQTAYCPTLVVD